MYSIQCLPIQMRIYKPYPMSFLQISLVVSYYFSYNILNRSQYLSHYSDSLTKPILSSNNTSIYSLMYLLNNIKYGEHPINVYGIK